LMGKRFCLSVLVFLQVATVTAVADTISLPNVPDFYQHQKAYQKQYPPRQAGESFFGLPPAPQEPPGTIPSYNLTTNWWENAEGWCCIAAFADSLYALNNRLACIYNTGGANWLENMVYNVEDLKKKYLDASVPFATILSNEGFGADRLKYSEYFVDASNKIELAAAPSLFCGVCSPGAGTVTSYSAADRICSSTLRLVELPRCRQCRSR